MTVQEWLGEDNKLGIDIWEKKYKFKDESFDEWLNRVSSGNKELKEMIKNKEFLFGGRILANRGLQTLGKKVSFSNCFIKDTQVLTINGYKNIQDIKIGEMVLTHTGKYQRVDNVLSRDYNGELYKLKTYKSNDIYTTDEHPFLTQDGWKKTKELSKNDYIKFMKEQVIDEDYVVNLTDKYKLNNNQEFEKSNGMVRINTHFVGGNNAKSQCSTNWIKEEILIDNDMKYVLGRWLGDGSITQRKVSNTNSIFQIVFNKKEKDDFNRCKKILENKLKIKSSCRENEAQSTLILRIENPIFSEWIYNVLGKNCEEKYIKDLRLLKSMDLVYGLIDADGLITADGQMRISLKNEKLLQQIKNIMLSHGIPCGEIKKVKNNKTFFIYEFRVDKFVCCNLLLPYLNKKYDDNRMNMSCNDSVTYLIKDNEIYVRIKEISKFDFDKLQISIPVYNISVHEDNSYIVDNLVVHNCYVIAPPKDNLESIFDTAKKLARTYSYGGGCGVDISKLRPRGTKVNNAAESTSGAVSFMDLYNLTTEIIGQKGRRGALMLSLDVSHPDIEEFIKIKSDLTKIQKANISVKITDEFMEAVEEGKLFNTEFKIESTGEVIKKQVNAKKLFNELAKQNWDFAEPGILFWDRISRWNLLSEDEEFEYAGTNPCALILGSR